jgi:hypothetical protein
MNFTELSEKWDLENAFWNARERADTYDLVEPGQDYTGWPTMEKQCPTEFYRGDWVKAEDYMRDVERLEKLLRDNGIEY